MSSRLTLLITSPRIPAGLLTRDAWQALDEASLVLAASADDPTPAALAANGVVLQAISQPWPQLAQRLVAACDDGPVVWVGSPDADPGLTDALAVELTRRAESAVPEPPEVEVLVASWDPPGARLLDAVAVMDALRSPDGCPWDAEQTHESLTPYLIEEAHETAEAIAAHDQDHLAEELGDILLQVLFHARIATEHPDDPFDIDVVAAELVAKMIRRHPHVFGDSAASTPEQVEQEWERIKAQEKPQREVADLLAGIPASLPMSYVIAKVRARLRRRGADPALDARLASLDVAAQASSEDSWRRLRELLTDERGRE